VIKLEKTNIILLSILTAIVILSVTTVVVFASNFFEVKEFNIPPSIKGDGIFFEPSAVSAYGDKLIILNDKQEEKNLMYFYISDINGNITGKYPIDAGRDIKDFEAITHCEEQGVFYALLSHSYGDENKRGLFKISFSGDNHSVTSIPEKERDVIYDSFNRIINGREINIEGLAYYKGKYNEFLFMGLREPVSTNETGVWRLNFKDIKEGHVQTPTLWFKFLADTGNGKKESISSIEYYPEIKMLFILTSYEEEADRGGALWIAGADNPENYGIDLPKYPVYQWKGVKPEGITIIKDGNSKNLLFVVFDNDEKETGIKGTFTVLPLEELI
jgi:hypothetical protein